MAFLAILVVALLQSKKPFYGDSGTYWHLGDSFVSGARFSLLNFSDAWRGYFLPLTDHGLQSLASALGWTASSMAKIFNALIFATIGALLAPAFATTIWPASPPWGLARRLALAGLLVVFWSGFLNFPLSDLPGVAMALLTLIAVAHVDSPRWMLLAGAALAASVDIRAAYLPLVPVVAVLVLWAWFDQRRVAHAGARRRALCAASLAAAFALVSLPQSLSAHRYHGTWSFVPGASIVEPAAMYYTTGMPVQAYDTYVGHDRPGVEVNYIYPAGAKLLSEQPQARIASTGQYAGLFLSHPLVMGGLIARHVINGLDPLYTTPYIENLSSGWRQARRVAGLLLVCLALLRLLWPAARRRLGAGRMRYLLALSACTLTTLPSSMERRYLLPVYVICYVLALMPGWPNPLDMDATGLVRYRGLAVPVVLLVGFGALGWYVTGDAISHMRLGV
jgi:hypothetical protein